MRVSRTITGLAVAMALAMPAAAQDRPAPSAAVTSLGDLMAVIQLRHAKLWYAASLENWSLAEYELAQLETNLLQAGRLYPDMPASEATAGNRLSMPIGEAIKVADRAKFDRAFDQLTSACNACHQAAGRSFIVMRRPSRFSPFSNQLYSAGGRK
jgi:hypothetical protein